MQLIPNWANVLKRAWSLRIMAVAFVLTGAEAALPFIAPDVHKHLWILALANVIIIPCAFAARLIAQEGVTNGQ